MLNQTDIKNTESKAKKSKNNYVQATLALMQKQENRTTKNNTMHPKKYDRLN